MVVDEDVLVLRFMRRALTPSLDRLLTRFLAFRELHEVYVSDFFFFKRALLLYSIAFRSKKQQNRPTQSLGIFVV